METKKNSKYYKIEPITEFIIKLADSNDPEMRGIYNCYINNQAFFEFVNIINDFMTAYIVGVYSPKQSSQMLGNILLSMSRICDYAIKQEKKYHEIMVKYLTVVSVLAQDKGVTVDEIKQYVDEIADGYKSSHPGHGINTTDSGGEN